MALKDNSDNTFFGHPRGLSTLFFTEMWERFSYYGMRALLVLFMVASVEEGGMGLDDKTGNAIYGLYAMMVYLLALPGGWVADRLLGLRKAVFYGGCLITLGHFCLALPYTQTFFLGLFFIVVGTGLLKPNISSMVGALYPPDQQDKRDSGFSVFYMGINLGAFSAPFITSYLGENINWHYGFAAAGLGMVLGLVQYKLSERNLGEIGLQPSRNEDPSKQKSFEKNIKISLWILAIGIGLLILLLMLEIIKINPVTIAQVSTLIIAGSVILYFAYIFIFEKLDAQERKKLAVIGILFIFSSMFWAGYEQQGSSLNLFAERYTDRMIFGWEMPAGWLQSAPPIFVVIFSPIFAWLWLRLNKKKLNPSTPVKFSLGLFFMGLGYLVMIGAALVVVDGQKALPAWLVTTYLLHTFGEICLYPVGLSAVTKLSPTRLGGQMMGVWFMSLAFGNLIAGLFAGEFDENAIAANPQLLPDLFWIVVKVMMVSGLIILLLNKWIRKLMGEVR
ncbi:MAG TPA: peptide MFS transporter [Cytophagales bacterium]|nr:peptide MFS transporter [Cytophagales bacterium]